MERLSFPIATLPAAILVSLLFAFLHAASSFRPDLSTTATIVRPPDYTAMHPPVEIEPPVRRKPQLVKPEPKPSTPIVKLLEDKGIDLDVAPIRPELGPDSGMPHGREGTGPDARPFGPRLVDSEPLAIVRVEPQYPPKAERRELEGWVHVRFTITTAGSVENAVVVKSSHSVFERAALQAVAKWKYQPQMKDGKPVEATTETVLRFQMPKG
ncbi:MAG TPA: TonB family protein [Myxococcota bacterium]|nr:TonB family protein [Myxococcota bacterium]